jgi:hypothetical protein
MSSSARSVSIFFHIEADKIFNLFALRGIDMRVSRQNIGNKGVVGKILWNKELALVLRGWNCGIDALPLLA